MSARNVENTKKVLDLFCRKELAEAASYFAEDATLRNNVSPDVKRGRQAIYEHLVRWYSSFSDAAAHSMEFIDAGDTVIGMFHGEGTHTGPLGDFPATGKRYSIRYCEIYRFDAEGKIIANEAFYDSLSLLRQLGLAP